MLAIISHYFSVLQTMMNFFQVCIFFHWSAWSLFSFSGYLVIYILLLSWTPGWSQLAQFTISVMHKDPKKSKFSGDFSNL